VLDPVNGVKENHTFDNYFGTFVMTMCRSWEFMAFPRVPRVCG
jgi:hypothetical protein